MVIFIVLYIPIFGLIIIPFTCDFLFHSVSAFEFTSVLGVFDLFEISLYHGWLVDPRDTELASIVGDRTYNRLVEEIIHLKASANPDDVQKGNSCCLSWNFLLVVKQS